MNQTKSQIPAHRSGLGGRSSAKLLNGRPHQSNALGAFTVLLVLALTLPLNRAWAADPAKPQKDLPRPGEVFEVDGCIFHIHGLKPSTMPLIRPTA